MTNLLTMFRGENGMNVSFRIVDSSGTEQSLDAYNAADSTIVFKNAANVADLTVTSTYFSFSSPNVVWVPQDTDWAALTKKNYTVYIHLRNDSTPLETISKHYMCIEEV